ncbi:MAG: 30S ribosomal protein S3 [Marine Group III euryarchaeote CG-Epi3]|jgi:small subunit ribosomal protein S3|uniref:Small ribosomal subunit protein uS3 n=1 Tax=Marine Group III euryarchaeote CG-Epi3 TaxID=1888997 RepID=A0A1J5TR77_9ARCH|nr:MAG: 30S ribosomal protein S3 [Marine Group III euryarchaeote CG-Epi3]|tara:strand:+ start:904 stop:1659 length:756 start_codon:yes stop_codon:yes gene_type:complete
MTIVKEMLKERVRRVQVHDYVQNKTTRAGFGGLSIQRTPLGTHVRIAAERPGLVIGRKGSDIQRLTEELERKFGYENLQVEAGEVNNFALNPLIMAAKVANALERGWNYRRAGNSMLQRIMDSGARGCQITIAGKLTGLRHRTEKFLSGHIKFCGETALELMDVGIAQAKLKPGTIGVKVAIMRPDAKLPDEIEVTPLPVPVSEVKEEDTEAAAEEKSESKDDKKEESTEAVAEEKSESKDDKKEKKGDKK